MEQPLYDWDPVIAPSGMMFYTGDKFPSWLGSLVVGGMTARRAEARGLAGVCPSDNSMLTPDAREREMSSRKTRITRALENMKTIVESGKPRP
jgi:glucose/arabinose dehydrogenase